jgi:hypothetical protein
MEVLIMSNTRNEIWVETFFERLHDKCHELNKGREDNPKYIPKDIVEHCLYHDNVSLMELSPLVDEAVDKAIEHWDFWIMEEKTPLEDRI